MQNTRMFNFRKSSILDETSSLKDTAIRSKIGSDLGESIYRTQDRTAGLTCACSDARLQYMVVS